MYMVLSFGPTLQNKITRTPLAMRYRIRAVASESALLCPDSGSCGSFRGGFQMRKSLRPAGAPSSVTSTTFWKKGMFGQMSYKYKLSWELTETPNISDICRPGFAIVALHDTNWTLLSKNSYSYIFATWWWVTHCLWLHIHDETCGWLVLHG